MKRRRVSWLVCGSALACLLAPASSVSAAATPTVANLGQPGLLSTVPQAPVVLAARASCAQARTVEEANGAASPCPIGTWPEQGSPDWFASAVDAIAGDTLELTFAGPQDAVTVTTTTTYPVGLRTPPCPAFPAPVPCANGDTPVLNTGAVQSASPTSDPARWTVTVPNAITAQQVAVTGLAGSSAANLVFGVGGPRWDDESAKCGTAFLSPTDVRYLCPSKLIHGYPTRPGDTINAPVAQGPAQLPGEATAPEVVPRVAWLTRPKLRGSKLRLQASVSMPGRLTIRLRRGGRTLLRRSTTVDVGPATRSYTVPRPVRRTLANHARRKYSLVLELTAGGTKVSAKRDVRWHRR